MPYVTYEPKAKGPVTPQVKWDIFEAGPASFFSVAQGALRDLGTKPKLSGVFDRGSGFLAKERAEGEV